MTIWVGDILRQWSSLKLVLYPWSLFSFGGFVVLENCFHHRHTRPARRDSAVSANFYQKTFFLCASCVLHVCIQKRYKNTNSFTWGWVFFGCRDDDEVDLGVICKEMLQENRYLWLKDFLWDFINILRNKKDAFVRPCRAAFNYRMVENFASKSSPLRFKSTCLICNGRLEI